MFCAFSYILCIHSFDYIQYVNIDVYVNHSWCVLFVYCLLFMCIVYVFGMFIVYVYCLCVCDVYCLCVCEVYSLWCVLFVMCIVCVVYCLWCVLFVFVMCIVCVCDVYSLCLWCVLFGFVMCIIYVFLMCIVYVFKRVDWCMYLRNTPYYMYIGQVCLSTTLLMSLLVMFS